MFKDSKECKRNFRDFMTNEELYIYGTYMGNRPTMKGFVHV